MNDPTHLVNWFRQSAPYINGHRKKTFVILMAGEAIEDPNFPNVINDIALLNSFGIRLVLVFGARPQIEERLREDGHESQFHNNLRITDDRALTLVKQATGTLRSDIESLLSRGVSNSPMQNARLSVVGGNFVTAQPMGVEDGVDYCHTGKVRRVDVESIDRQLDKGGIILLAPLGYSVTGEVFNLASEEVATRVASAIKADKLITLCSEQGIIDPSGNLISELMPDDAQRYLEQRLASKQKMTDTEHNLAAAIKACRKGVQRCHLISFKADGALLQELFTRDGIGTQLVEESSEKIRSATVDDIGGIIELIRPLEEQGVLVKRSRELLEMEIEQFTVVERDGMVIACAALHVFPEDAIGEMACLVTHPEYRKHAKGDLLLQAITNKAKALGLKQMFVLTTKSIHWFRERNFELCELSDLPLKKQEIYNLQRRSKILIRDVQNA